MCFKTAKKKRRRSTGKRVRRKEEPLNRKLVEDPGFLGDQVAEEFAQENFRVDRPDHNVIEPIPITEQAPTATLNMDTVSYSKSADPHVHIPIPQSNRVSQTNANFEREERIITKTVKAVEEENKEVINNPTHFDLIKPPLEPAFVNSQDYYPVPRESEEKREEYKQKDFTNRVEYRNQTPDVKKIVVPQKISVNVLEAGYSQPKVIATNTSDTVFELRFKIFEKTRILPTNQILVFGTRELPLHKQLGECGIENYSDIELTDHGKDITEFIIEITDAKSVLQLKSDLRKLEDDIKEAKKRSVGKLKKNEWIDASRLVDMARVLEIKKKKKVEELKEIHKKHKNGFRQLHIKIIRLFTEKRKSSAAYQKLKYDLVVAIQKNEVLRSRDIVEKLMIQFICHDGCARELMLLEAFVPDMIEAARGGTRDDLLDDPRGETKKTPPPRDLNQYEPPVKPYTQQVIPMPRGQDVYGEDQYYAQDGRYSAVTAYQEPTIVPRAFYEPQPQIQYNPMTQQFISGGQGDPGANYQ